MPLQVRLCPGRHGPIDRAKLAALCVAAIAASGCDKMPLLAPSGTVITLFASSTVMPVNGSVEITATLIEQGTTQAPNQQQAAAGAGTPVHNGTLVSFTTTLGSIEPREARTHNGQVTVRLLGDGRSGVAKVTAFSGGARSAELQISVGAAAAERIVLTATPQQVPSTGGTVELAARVEDASGNPLPGVPVTFSATGGALAATTVVTDETGVARTTLTTSREVDVTASAGAKTATIKVQLAPRLGLTLATTTTNPTAGVAVVFQVGVSATANVRAVTIDFGDGSQQALGALTSATSVAHVYGRDGTYRVTATAADASGSVESVSTTVVVAPAPRLGVAVSSSTANPAVGQPVVFTVTVTVPANSPGLSGVSVDFGDGSAQSAGPTASLTVSHVYTNPGAYTVTATATDHNGQASTASTQIVVAPISVTVTATKSSTNPRSFTFTAAVTPSGVAIASYEWRFGDGTTVTTSGNTTSHIYAASVSGRTEVRVIVHPVSGSPASTTIEIDVG
jgi:adhesin/invasin